MSEGSEALGARLKAERERRGMSAAKAADELHLDTWVIDALEAEDYERVGPSVYAKGHLKRYAALLGLPPAEIIAGYENRVLAPKPAPLPPANVRLQADPPPVSNLPLPQLLGTIAAIALLAGVLWWKPWHQRGVPAPAVAADSIDTSMPPSSSEPTAPPPTAPAASPVPVMAPAAASAAAQPTVAQPVDPTAGTGRARLRLSFSADSWVDIHDAQGKRAFAGKGRANSVKVIHGVAPMRVFLGFASGVQLEINDRAVAIGPQFVAGDVARFEAGADGILRRDSHVGAPTRPTG